MKFTLQEKLRIVGSGLAQEMCDKYWHDYVYLNSAKGILRYYIYFHDTYSGVHCWQKIWKWQLNGLVKKYIKA